METNENVSEEFVEAITVEIVKLIANNENIPLDQADKEFKNSKVYEYLTHPSMPFRDEGPEYFFECFKNYKKHGLIMDDIDYMLYLRNK